MRLRRDDPLGMVAVALLSGLRGRVTLLSLLLLHGTFARRST